MTLKELAKAKGFSVDQLHAYHVRDSLLGERVEIPYLNRHGEELPRVRYRYDDREFQWSAGNGPMQLYGLWQPVPWDEEGIICEGESDCWALWSCGVPALGVPGAGMVKLLNGKLLQRIRRIGIVREPDEAGAQFAFNAAQQLYATGFTGECSAISFAPYKDARDAFNANFLNSEFFSSAFWNERQPIPRAPGASPRILTARELLHRPNVELTWAWQDVIIAGGLVLLVARPKVGKSTFASNLMLAMARGNAFLDRPTKKASILWWALEEPEAHVRRRFEILGLTDEDPIGFSFDPVPDRPDEFLHEHAEYDVIVVDTLGRFYPRLQNINDYSEVTRTLSPVERFTRETKRIVFFVHHAGWGDAGRALGSTAIQGTADCILTLLAYSKNRALLSSVQRGGDPFEKFVVNYDKESESVSIATSKLDDYEDLIETLFSGTPLTRDEIFSMLPGKSSNKNNAVMRMIHNGELVHVSGTGARGSPVRYLPRAQAPAQNGNVIPFKPPLYSISDFVPPVPNEPIEPIVPNGPNELKTIIVVGRCVGVCCVCGEERDAHRLVDGRAWCTVCYDKGDRPE